MATLHQHAKATAAINVLDEVLCVFVESQVSQTEVFCRRKQEQNSWISFVDSQGEQRRVFIKSVQHLRYEINVLNEIEGEKDE